MTAASACSALPASGSTGATWSSRPTSAPSSPGAATPWSAAAAASRHGRASRGPHAPAGRIRSASSRGRCVDLEVADDDADELRRHRRHARAQGAHGRRADAFLALPGGLGTLEELLEIWVARTLGMHDKPVVVLDPDGVYAPLRQQVDLLGRARLRAAGGARLAALGRDVDEAFDAIEAGAARPRPARAGREELLEAEP